MYDVVLFGGTEEGRVLAEFLSNLSIKACVCVTTDYGADLIPPGLTVFQGEMAGGTADFLTKERPQIVIDATHPYASHISTSIAAACNSLGIQMLRVKRESSSQEDFRSFQSMEEMVSYLNASDEIIFSSLGSKEADILTEVRDFSERIHIRILPSTQPLQKCIGLGYKRKNIICMQGPFAEARNELMFRESGARILLTKDSGTVGGFPEKIAAAKSLGMEICILARPNDEDGSSVEEIKETLKARWHK